MFRNLDSAGTAVRRVGTCTVVGWGASRIWGERVAAGMNSLFRPQFGRVKDSAVLNCYESRQAYQLDCEYVGVVLWAMSDWFGDWLRDPQMDWP